MKNFILGFCANSIIPGTTIDQNGNKINDFENYGFDALELYKLTKQGYLKHFDGIYLINHFYNDKNDAKISKECLEIFRKKTGMNRYKFKDYMIELFELLNYNDLSCLDQYNRKPNTRNVRTEDYINKLFADYKESFQVKEYALRFSNAKKYDLGEMSDCEFVKKAISELKEIINTNVFRFRTKTYNTSYSEIFESMSKIEVVDLNNNNYLKKSLIGKIEQRRFKSLNKKNNVANSVEGY